MDKQLKKFSRKDLLEVLVAQSKEIETLKEQLCLAQQQLARRELAIRNAGSLAEAALHLNHIFQDADAAAQQYLASIKAMVQEEHLQEAVAAESGREPGHDA